MSAQLLEEVQSQALKLEVDDPDLSLTALVTRSLVHGGMLTAADPTTENHPALLAAGLPAMAPVFRTQFFFKLVDNKPLTIDDPLLDYLTSPVDGVVHSNADVASPEILAVFTFVGQFIDHDLTLNAIDLIDPQRRPDIVDNASPMLDLDSVYGPRLADGSATQQREVPMDAAGRFVLRQIDLGGGKVGYDVPRDGAGKALIGDKRNDENQIILQIHVLLIRLHNALIDKLHLSPSDAKLETIRHWQSVVSMQYLPTVAREAQVNLVRNRLDRDPDTLLDHRHQFPGGRRRRLGMPHEFAIGFRFGHSQLRSEYRLNQQHGFKLFDQTEDGVNDLRGDKPLAPERVIDWPFFLGEEPAKPDYSNLIDRLVNDVVFHLPKSAIPDNVKDERNLPRRNLIRSSNLGVCSGEDLAHAYNAHYDRHDEPSLRVLAPDEVTEQSGPFMTDKGFRTPLWFYLLKEAEVDRTGEQRPEFKLGQLGQLGQLGSRLVAEVVLAGIHHAEPSILRDPYWEAKIPVADAAKRKVTLSDIVRFVSTDVRSGYGQPVTFTTGGDPVAIVRR